MDMDDIDRLTSIPGLDSFRGRWVALLNGRIIGHGSTYEHALLAARQSRYKESPEVVYVPMIVTPDFPPILENIIEILPEDTEIYLAGGVIRDALLHRKPHDIDFVLSGDSLKVARSVANSIGAAYFPLDEERGTARLVLIESGGERTYFDFAAMRGTDLEGDLRARDFTINAMAVSIGDREKIIDPLNGAADLLAHKLEVCSSTAIKDDPVRILRAIRFAGDLELKITPDTLSLMRSELIGLTNISAERISAELFRILSGKQPGRAIRALDILGALPHILPELEALKGVDQSPPHTADVWQHTLATIKHLDEILMLLSGEYDPDKAANLINGMMVTSLGRYRQQISEHLATMMNVDRPLLSTLFFAALYHDVGKPQTKDVGDDGRIHFLTHHEVGSSMAAERAHKLRLSNIEIKRISTIIRNHLRPILLGQLDEPPTRRAVYRFFRDTGPAGVDICLLSLADTLAIHGVNISSDTWQKQIDVVRRLLDAWWESPQEQVSPPAILTGGDILERFNLHPGPLIGELLEAVREAQAMGLIHTHAQAIIYVKDLLQERDKS